LNPVISFSSVSARLISISVGGPSKLKAVSTVAGVPKELSLARENPRQPVVILFVVMQNTSGGEPPLDNV
jgi:hypothetical protein